MKNTGENYRTVDEIIDHGAECPLDLSVIPNTMGINLCSVEGVSWHRQEDGQLTELKIHFKPKK